MFFSTQNREYQYGENAEPWDIARCHVPYDGEVNLPFRHYEVSDHQSLDRPYDYGGLDEQLQKDKYQNWAVNQNMSNSTCPEGLFQKCVFTCFMARRFTTEDPQDIDYNTPGLSLNLNVAYLIYEEGVLTQKGASQFENWRTPMFTDHAAGIWAGVAVGLLGILTL